jgi:hypothetical protein
MASIISAGTTSATALNMSADTTGVLQLASNNGTVALTVNTSQQVGVGTATPAYQLDLNGGTTVNNRVQIRRGSDDTGQSMRIGWDRIESVRDNQILSAPMTSLSFIQTASNGSRTTMLINSNGSVTQPLQPAFSGYKSQTTISGGSQAQVTPDVITFNTGSNYNSGNGRFTASVAGKYVVMINMRRNTGADPSGYFGCNAKKNGSDASSWMYNLVTGYSDDSTWAHMIVDLAVNDYLEFYGYPQDTCTVFLEAFVYLLG